MPSAASASKDNCKEILVLAESVADPVAKRATRGVLDRDNAVSSPLGRTKLKLKLPPAGVPVARAQVGDPFLRSVPAEPLLERSRLKLSMISATEVVCYTVTSKRWEFACCLAHRPSVNATRRPRRLTATPPASADICGWQLGGCLVAHQHLCDVMRVAHPSQPRMLREGLLLVAFTVTMKFSAAS